MNRSRGNEAAQLSLLAPAICLFVLLAWVAVASGQEGPSQADKQQERRQYVIDTPEFQERMHQQTGDDLARQAAIRAEELAAGGDARFYGSNLCQFRQRDCAGDARLLDWVANGFGLAEEVTFGGRTGATLSGTVWATEEGPAKRAGVVVVNGLDAPETHYWGLAQVLAKGGYVVLTFDPPAHGQSDSSGEAPDDGAEGIFENAVGSAEDALDFFLSTDATPYAPRPSCGNENGGTATDHSPKHQRRVDLGLNEASNPFAEMLDPKRIGLAGHSVGGGTASYLGQIDPRVDALAGWDNMTPTDLHEEGPPVCESGASTWPEDPPLKKPGIGFASEFTNLFGKGSDRTNDAVAAYRTAGVDTMQINRRGGSHFEYPFISGEVLEDLGRATLRGQDMAAWYTTAWFDKHLRCKGEPRSCERDADRRLLTDRWRDDEREGQIDPTGDANLYSIDLASIFDFEDAGGRQRVCEDMRAGCPPMKPDDGPPGYFLVEVTNTFDGDDGPGAPEGRCSVPHTGTDAADDPSTLPGTDSGDAMRGRGGDDDLRGRGGRDCIYGNRGDDQARGNRHADRLEGNRGNDELRGARGGDLLIGGPGEDLMIGGRGNDKLRSRDGEPDVLRCGSGKRDRVDADRRDSVGRSCEAVRVDGKRVR